MIKINDTLALWAFNRGIEVWFSGNSGGTSKVLLGDIQPALRYNSYNLGDPFFFYVDSLPTVLKLFYLPSAPSLTINSPSVSSHSPT